MAPRLLNYLQSSSSTLQAFSRALILLFHTISDINSPVASSRNLHLNNRYRSRVVGMIQCRIVQHGWSLRHHSRANIRIGLLGPYHCRRDWIFDISTNEPARGLGLIFSNLDCIIESYGPVLSVDEGVASHKFLGHVGIPGCVEIGGFAFESYMNSVAALCHILIVERLMNVADELCKFSLNHCYPLIHKKPLRS